MEEQKTLTKGELLLFQTKLSERQKEVLRCTADGQTAPEIGRTLKMTARTVETHREHIYAKLERSSFPQICKRVKVRSISGLVWFASVTGLIDTATPP